MTSLFKLSFSLTIAFENFPGLFFNFCANFIFAKSKFIRIKIEQVSREIGKSYLKII